MQIGQVVDFCIDYNNRQKTAEKENDGTEQATQAQIDAYFG